MGKRAASGSGKRERFAGEVLGALDLHQHGEAFLLRIAVFLGLDQALPNLVIDRARFMDRGRAVEAGDAAIRQRAALAQLRLAEEGRR